MGRYHAHDSHNRPQSRDLKEGRFRQKPNWALGGDSQQERIEQRVRVIRDQEHRARARHLALPTYFNPRIIKPRDGVQKATRQGGPN
jgi:hypothetical protein